MSTTEALRTRLDALQREFYAVQAENRKLKEKNPQQAEALELEQELSQSREENVQMAQEISELREAAQRDEANETNARLESEITQLHQSLDKKCERLAEKEAALERAVRSTTSAEEYVHELEEKLMHTQQETELERLRAVAEETRKWEEREARLVRRVEKLEHRAKAVPELSGGAGGSGEWGTRRGSTAYSGETAAQQLQDSARYALPISPCVGGEALSGPPIQPGKPDSVADRPTDNNVGLSTDNLGLGLSTDNQGVSVGSRSVVFADASYSGGNGFVGTQTLDVSAPEFVPPTGNATADGAPARSAGRPLATTVTTNSREATAALRPSIVSTPPDTLTMALLAQQLPPLPNFTGNNLDADGETFEDWLERLELVAATCHWNDQTKLVNIATRLRGSASHFYRSCPPQQRANYSALASALKQRFTPVRLQAVQSSRFHERRQEQTESVDGYAQDLRRLFCKAYSSAEYGDQSDAMAQSVLAYQFVSGLRSDLKTKLVGREGTFEQLLAAARFEEARFKEVINPERTSHQTHAPHAPPPSRKTLMCREKQCLLPQGHVSTVGEQGILPENADYGVAEHHGKRKEEERIGEDSIRASGRLITEDGNLTKRNPVYQCCKLTPMESSHRR